MPGVPLDDPPTCSCVCVCVTARDPPVSMLGMDAMVPAAEGGRGRCWLDDRPPPAAAASLPLSWPRLLWRCSLRWVTQAQQVEPR